MELMKQGRYLSYFLLPITFLTIQSKENMRRLFLGLQSNQGKAVNEAQASLFGDELTTHIPAQQKDIFGKTKSVQIELVNYKKDVQPAKPEVSQSVKKLLAVAGNDRYTQSLCCNGGYCHIHSTKESPR